MSIGRGHTYDDCVIDCWGLLGVVGNIELNSTVIILCYDEIIKKDVACFLSQNSIFKIFVDSKVGKD